MRVLIVEDDATVLAVLKGLFEREGHTVSAFSDVVSAVQEWHIAIGEFDVIVSDWNLGDATFNGQSCFDLTRDLVNGQPFVFFTTDVEAASKCGAPVVSKPNYRELINTAERLVGDV